MPNIGPMELVVVLVVALLIIGPKKLPEAGRSLGEGLRSFRSSLTETSAATSVDARTSPETREPTPH